MKRIKDLQEKVLVVEPAHFEVLAMEVFQFQARENPVYKRYLNYLGVRWEKIHEIEEIPFLPIEFFKTQSIRTGIWKPEITFESSGTGYGVRSKHDLQDVRFYQSCARKAFERLYGPLSNYGILALLPSYLERQNSSLIAMVQYFIQESGNSPSGFFLDNQNALLDQFQQVLHSGKIPLLIGVSFALLDLAEKGADLSGALVMETGGMKGRRKELVRLELHQFLKKGLNVPEIHSEYGMTELLSQAYALKNGVFETPAWMKVLIRDINDPFSYTSSGRTGGVNVIDLANVHSCSFIETQDLGASQGNGTFEILGRFDNSETRGCNLLLLS